ncbi:HAMP domain-containing histidine kinase [Deinococcus metallilatus]|uniref:histidine kinase n=1 Tax=Deinococcus metallilatus TaxID=1211322 RepID=A0AAJ5F224_9DEIO|nr:HAMP domain-containing sensor histidine kinase [Deinococcus metallilatus]MBB5294356.1 signal transduction histidine kinase [Deinococcus metallilatus]QBY09124.1 HAMP domain-containing histidine kinase [Deinococcus metallilatus]RXJ10268.1 HAMP domain-containing histidine kinase [Deinococcus metallilatus]TLK22560.1 HAMP domain-containing histidine kinase [Deinococcus metallilatus]GMA16306.1 sensor histidine kinase [Deinococcus metallilatus]
MPSADSPVVFVVSHDRARADLLVPVLGQAEVFAIPDAETLLREAHVHPPAVALLYADTRGVPLAEVLPLLRQRAELAGTYWLAVGSAGLGALLAAGADALISDATPPEALALQVRALLARAARHRELEGRIGQLQRRLETWEHEERVRDQLVHMLVHDLKNPIAAVMGLLEVVEDDDRVPDDTRELVKVAHDETQHLLHLAVNMLDVRKIQAGKMHLRPELVFSPMFEEVIEQACGDVGSGLRDRHIGVEVAPNLSPTRADPDILRRIFANLISNALKHTTTGGLIQIQVRQAEDETQITVRDDGEGIPADDLPNLFAAFEQSRLTLHGRFDTGMGLAFCKLAVEEHGGHIWAESERGHGSTFIFTLPLAQDSEDDDFVELLN